MKVSEMIKILSHYPDSMEIIITDGFQGNFYRGEYSITEFEDVDGQVYVDIGIGGQLED